MEEKHDVCIEGDDSENEAGHSGRLSAVLREETCGLTIPAHPLTSQACSHVVNRSHQAQV